jgi:hypothetical protein
MGKDIEAIMLEGLRLALCDRTQKLFNVYTTPDEPNADARLAEGVRRNVKAYKTACEIIRRECKE